MKVIGINGSSRKDGNTEKSYKSSSVETTVKVSFQFHHTQMNCVHATTFLGLIQQRINNL